MARSTRRKDSNPKTELVARHFIGMDLSRILYQELWAAMPRKAMAEFAFRLAIIEYSQHMELSRYQKSNELIDTVVIFLDFSSFKCNLVPPRLIMPYTKGY
jgi:hypothetical protein